MRDHWTERVHTRKERCIASVVGFQLKPNPELKKKKRKKWGRGGQHNVSEKVPRKGAI